VKRLNCRIERWDANGDFIEWDFITEIEINSSWAEFTETAKLTFPNKIQYKNKPIVNGDESIFKRGDNIEIFLGYDDTIISEFSGYITKIIPGVPIVLECENEAFLLKQKTIKKLSFKSVTLKELLTAIIPDGIPVVSPDAKLGAFRITNATSMQVLDELKKTYGFPAFFRNGTLYVGQTYVGALRETHVVEFENDVISSDLEYKRKEDLKIKVKAISMLEDNTKIEIETGDDDGELRTLTFYNITSETELEKIALAELDRLKFDGYAGSFEMFGQPTIQHQHVVEIIDGKFPERSGEYFVKSHGVTFGQSGFRRNIELGTKSL